MSESATAGARSHRGPSRRSVLAGGAAALAAAAIPIAAARAATAAGAAVGSGPPPLYLDTRYAFAERAADLVSRMTLAEKVAQLADGRFAAICDPCGLCRQLRTFWLVRLVSVVVKAASREAGPKIGRERRPRSPLFVCDRLRNAPCTPSNQNQRRDSGRKAYKDTCAPPGDAG